jgi:hypothetical protein
MKRTSFVTALVFCVSFAALVDAQVVNHIDIAKVKSFPQAKMDAIGQQKWFFAHASVGGNMISGLNDLHKADAKRFQLTTISVKFEKDLHRAENPPASTAAGTVYECGRGNPGWDAKTAIFVNSVQSGGWHDPAVDAVMDKYCYIDENADANVYLNKLAELEKAWPRTKVVYTTIPLTTAEDNDNVLRNQFNDTVRKYCKKNKKLLFDIADMEAYSPEGKLCAFTKDGKTYQKLFSGYTKDGGHLNEQGRKRIATGWYAVAGCMAAKKK